MSYRYWYMMYLFITLSFSYVYCPVLLCWAGISLTISHTCSFRWVSFPPCLLPPQQLAQWPLWLLLQSFRRLSMSIYAGLARIHFHWTAPHLGRSVRGDSCVCNLKNSVAVSYNSVFILFWSWGVGAARGRPAVLYISHLYWTRSRWICLSVSSSVRSGQAHMSPVVLWGSVLATQIMEFPTELFYWKSSVHFGEALRKAHTVNVKPNVSFISLLFHCFSALKAI